MMFIKRVFCMMICIVLTLSFSVGKTEQVCYVASMYDSNLQTLYQYANGFQEAGCVLPIGADMYIISDLNQNEVYLAENKADGVQVYLWNIHESSVERFDFSPNLSWAFAYGDGWIYGVSGDKIIRERDGHTEVYSLVPNDWDWRNGRNFKPTISVSGILAFVSCRGEKHYLDIACPQERLTPDTISENISIPLSAEAYDACPIALWINETTVLCLLKSKDNNHCIAIRVNVESECIEPWKLINGSLLTFENCEFGNLAAISSDGENIYLSMNLSSDQMWYMYDESGAPFDIYRISLIDGARNIAAKLSDSAYITDNSQIALIR